MAVAGAAIGGGELLFQLHWGAIVQWAQLCRVLGAADCNGDCRAVRSSTCQLQQQLQQMAIKNAAVCICAAQHATAGCVC